MFNVFTRSIACECWTLAVPRHPSVLTFRLRRDLHYITSKYSCVNPHSFLRPFDLPEDGDEVGGEGGAIYTGEGSMTTFKRRTIHHDNTAGNGGGALWNEGTTALMSNGFIKGNSATVRAWSRPSAVPYVAKTSFWRRRAICVPHTTLSSRLEALWYVLETTTHITPRHACTFPTI